MERINSIYIISYEEIRFGLRTFRFTDNLTERITYVNRGSTVCSYLKLRSYFGLHSYLGLYSYFGLHSFFG